MEYPAFPDNTRTLLTVVPEPVNPEQRALPPE